MRIQFNDSAFAELLTSGAAKALLESHAEQIAARANAVASTTDPAATEPYYEIADGSDGERARLRIHPTSARTARHEAKTQALQRSM